MSIRNSADWTPFLASVGLFLASVTVAHHSPFHGRRFRDDNVDQMQDEVDDTEALRKWYRSRRVHDRLSYENIHDFLPGPQNHHHQHQHQHQQHQQHQQQHLEEISHHPSFETSLLSSASLPDENERTVRRGNSNQPIATSMSTELFDPPSHPGASKGGKCQSSEWDQQRQARATRHHFTRLERRDSHVTVASHPNADYDFHPKNRNWRHFEHFNERDPRRNLHLQPPWNAPTHPSVSPVQQTQQPKLQRQQDTNEDQQDGAEHMRSLADNGMETSEDDDDDEDIETAANSISSSGSESSEEQFVWMKPSHRRKMTPPVEENKDSWKVPSFLNIFSDPETDVS